MILLDLEIDFLDSVRSLEKGPSLHKESLLNFHLLKQVFEDLDVKNHLVPRAVDSGWLYKEVIRDAIGGFNPYSGKLFYCAESALSGWIDSRTLSARPFNFKDRLAWEALVLVHDYLHLWSYKIIQSNFPEVGLGKAPITKANIEDFVFCHLVTEAAAVVGLDYWALCQKKFNDHCPIGTKIQTMAVSYSEDNIEEFRRFYPGFEVMSPSFLKKISEFYCHGQFFGFDGNDVKQSPLLMDWLQHEIYYGELQRVYSRNFLSLIASEEVHYSREELKQPVSLEGAWKAKLLELVGKLLWEKVVEDQLHSCSSLPVQDLWGQVEPRQNNWPYVNLNRCSEAELFDGMERSKAGKGGKEDPARHFATQLLSRYRYDQFEKEEIQFIKRSFQEQEYASLFTLGQERERLLVHEGEPKHLLMLT